MIRSSGSPKVFAQPACRRSSSNRSGVEASRSDPTSCHDGSDAGLGGQSPVQVGAVHHHLGERHGAAELADEAGGVERRAGRELGAVDEDDVGPAELGQVVRDGGPADAATDDDRPGVSRHRARRLLLLRPTTHSVARYARRRRAMTPTIEQVIAAIPAWAGRAVTAERDPGRADQHQLPGRGRRRRRSSCASPGAATELLAVDRGNELHNTRAAAAARVSRRGSLHTLPELGRLRPRVAATARTMSNAAFARPGCRRGSPRRCAGSTPGRGSATTSTCSGCRSGTCALVDERDDPDPGRLSRAPAPGSRGSRRPSPSGRCRPSRATTTSSPRTTSTTGSGCGSSTTSTAATTTRPSSSATPPGARLRRRRRSRELCAAYFGEATAALLARMRLQMIMSDVGWTLWAAIQAAHLDDRLRLLGLGRGALGAARGGARRPRASRAGWTAPVVAVGTSDIASAAHPLAGRVVEHVGRDDRGHPVVEDVDVSASPSATSRGRYDEADRPRRGRP